MGTSKRKHHKTIFTASLMKLEGDMGHVHLLLWLNFEPSLFSRTDLNLFYYILSKFSKRKSRTD